jgi:hypothetical protein
MLHVSANHVAIFRWVKYKGWIEKEYKMKLQKYQKQYMHYNKAK